MRLLFVEWVHPDDYRRVMHGGAATIGVDEAGELEKGDVMLLLEVELESDRFTGRRLWVTVIGVYPGSVTIRAVTVKWINRARGALARFFLRVERFC